MNKMLKNDDIFLVAIKRTAEKYVKDYVKVKVFKEERFRRYILQLSIGDEEFYTRSSYQLHPGYVNRESYIMRVVSDLCIELAKMTNKERNDFFEVNRR